MAKIKRNFLEAVARHEGFYIKGSVAQRLHNPGNLVSGIGKYYGMVDTWKNPASGLTFSVFKNDEDGWKALEGYMEESIHGIWKGYAREAKARGKNPEELSMAEFFGVYAPVGWENFLRTRHKPNIAYADSVSKLAKIPFNSEMKDLVDNSVDNPEPVDNSIPLAYYWQNNPRYKGVKLGNSNYSFQTDGCFTCCLSYMAGLDPLVAMEKLKKGGGYSGALIISDKAAKILGINYSGKDYNINNMPDWSPSIKEVDFSPRPGKQQHFVVRLIENGKKDIYDPYEGKRLPLNRYKFVSYRLFKRP